MDASSDVKDENKRPCYRCEYCYLCFTDRQSLEEHLKNCSSTLAMPKGDTYFESYMKTLQLAMLDEKEALDGLSQARTEANNAAMRYSEALQQRQNAEKAYGNALDRDIELYTAGSPGKYLIPSDAVKRSRQEFQAAMKELRSLGEMINQDLHELKGRNTIATFAVNKTHLAFLEAVYVYQTTVTRGVLVPGADEALQDIESTLKSRRSMLTELQNSITELEAAISRMEKGDLKKEELRIMENVNGRDPMQNAMKRKSRVDNKIDSSEENVDDPRPSASGIRKPDVKSEETKKISCSRRLSFS